MKAQEVRRLIEAGEFKKALSGAKDFRLGVTRDQRSVMARAYECFIRPEFYRSIGKDPAASIEEGIAVLKEVMA